MYSGPDIEITRDLIADDLGEQRHGVSSRNVFAKGHKMELPIDLEVFSRLRNEQRGIVIVPIVLIDRP